MDALVFFRSQAFISRAGDRLLVRIPALKGLAKAHEFTIFVYEYNNTEERTKNYANLLYQLGMEDISDGDEVTGEISFALTTQEKDGRKYIRLLIPHTRNYQLKD